MKLCKSIYTLCMMTIFLAIGIAGCISREYDKPVITVSIQPQKFLLEKITGDKWDIKCLLSNGADPESYDPTLTHLLNLENSKAYFRMGNIPFESAIINKIHNNNPGLRLYNNSEGINPIIGTHSHGEEGDEHANDVDPHTWTSVRNAKIIANNMYEAVVDLDPDNKAYYAKNLKKLMGSLDSLDTAISAKLQGKNGESFVVWHPSLSYFARDYGLHQIALSPEGKDMSIAMLQSAIESARADSAKVFFVQKEVDSRQAEIANEQIGAKTVSINPLSYNWDTEIISIADALAK